MKGSDMNKIYGRELGGRKFSVNHATTRLVRPRTDGRPRDDGAVGSPTALEGPRGARPAGREGRAPRLRKNSTQKRWTVPTQGYSKEAKAMGSKNGIEEYVDKHRPDAVSRRQHGRKREEEKW